MHNGQVHYSLVTNILFIRCPTLLVCVALHYSNGYNPINYIHVFGRQHNLLYVARSCILNVLKHFSFKNSRKMTRQGNFNKFKVFMDKVFLSQCVGINRYQLCFYFLSAFILLYIQVTLRIPVVNL